MATQLTLGIIKPDVFLRGVNSSHIIENIFKVINNQGLTVLKRKQINLTVKEAEAFYEEHRGKFFYPRLVSSVISGPVITFILQKENAISDWRSLMGPTHAARAKTQAPHSIRAHYGLSDTRNCVHGSDSPETAKREIQFFFPEYVVGTE